jgi:DedD protein
LNQSTKQRIVGTVVLLIAALILLPVIFDGDGSYQAPLESRIPAPPPFPEPARIIPDRTVVIADTEQIYLAPPAETQDQEESSVVPDAAPVAPDVGATLTGSAPAAQTEVISNVVNPAGLQLDNQGLPQGWTVRMGAFAVVSNADALVKDLQSKDLRAYSRSRLVNDAPMEVVYIGPLIDRAAAQQLLDKMNRDYTQLPGKRIEPFEINGL